VRFIEVNKSFWNLEAINKSFWSLRGHQQMFLLSRGHQLLRCLHLLLNEKIFQLDFSENKVVFFPHQLTDPLKSIDEPPEGPWAPG